MPGDYVTENLFHFDSYLREFDAAVTGVVSDGRGAVLDRTAFFPGGGGQPSDRGAIEALAVVDVRKVDGETVHLLDGQAPVAGSQIRGTLDWERRHSLMRTHTAMHVLCGVVFRDYGARVTGGEMEPLRGRMDFEFERLEGNLVRQIERAIDAEIAAAREVRTRFLPRQEAFQIPDLIRTKINLLPATIQEVRIVEIVGLDLQADGGTHVRNTSEIGRIRIADYKSKGAINKRIYVEIHDP
jgi:misacylated tRNA(Ala) deacylase